MSLKAIGYWLVSLGFLAGALVTVLDTTEVQWDYFGVTVLVAIIGIVIVRREIHKESTSEGKLTGNMLELGENLSAIVAELAAIKSSKAMENPYDINAKIVEKLPGYIENFVEARESIGHVYTLQDYAEVMTRFAAGERYLNRVWSASADGYIDESKEYIERSAKQFADALKEFEALGMK